MVVTGEWYFWNDPAQPGEHAWGSDVGFVGFTTAQNPPVGNMGMSYSDDRDEVENAFGFPGGAWDGAHMMMNSDFAGTLNPPGPGADYTLTGGDWCNIGGASGSPLFALYTLTAHAGYLDVRHVLSTATGSQCRWGVPDCSAGRCGL